MTAQDAAITLQARWSDEPFAEPCNDHLRITAQVADQVVLARTWPTLEGGFVLTVTRLIGDSVTGHGQVVGQVGDWVDQVWGLVPPEQVDAAAEDVAGPPSEAGGAAVPLLDALVLLQCEQTSTDATDTTDTADAAVRDHVLEDLRLAQVPAWLRDVAAARASVSVEAVQVAGGSTGSDLSATDDCRSLLVAVCGPACWWRLGSGDDGALLGSKLPPEQFRELLGGFCAALVMGGLG